MIPFADFMIRRFEVRRVSFIPHPLEGVAMPVSGLVSERASELSHVRVQLRFQIRTYIYIYIHMYVVVRQVMYAHARWYVLWEGFNVNHFLKHSNHFK